MNFQKDPAGRPPVRLRDHARAAARVRRRAAVGAEKDGALLTDSQTADYGSSSDSRLEAINLELEHLELPNLESPVQGTGPFQAARPSSSTSASNARRKRPPIQLRVPRVHLHPHRRPLQPVDLRRNTVQRFCITRAEVPSTGALRDFGQQRIVDFHRPVLIAKPEHAATHGDRRHSFGTHANRVDLHADRCRRLCRGARVDRTAVVHAVGQQHNDLAIVPAHHATGSRPSRSPCRWRCRHRAGLAAGCRPPRGRPGSPSSVAPASAPHQKTRRPRFDHSTVS